MAFTHAVDWPLAYFAPQQPTTCLKKEHGYTTGVIVGDCVGTCDGASVTAGLKRHLCALATHAHCSSLSQRALVMWGLLHGPAFARALSALAPWVSREPEVWGRTGVNAAQNHGEQENDEDEELVH